MFCFGRAFTLIFIACCSLSLAANVRLDERALNAGMRGLQLGVVDASAEQVVFAVQESGASNADEPELYAAGEWPFAGGYLWACPAGTSAAYAVIRSESWRVAYAGEFADSVIELLRSEPRELVRVAPLLSARGTKLASVAIHAAQYDSVSGLVRVCEQLEYSLEFVRGEAPDDRERLASAAFQAVLRGVVANLDDVEPVRPVNPEAYLIITPPAYAGTTLADFVHWKRQKGHSVTVATTNETGTQNTQIKNFIQNAYLNWAEPPVFVMMVGDVDGANPLPGWVMDGFHTATIISDHPYTLLEEGDDWVPDVLIGRLSVDSQTDLQTVVNKIVNYERQPFEPDGDWRTRMLVTGVRSTPGFFSTYNTAWPTLQWIARQFSQSGYTTIDSLPYPPASAQQINQRINAGVSFVAYRGFGSPHDWAFPPYDNDNISQLANGQRLPVIMSIVCGGGAFDSDVDPCFGEVWLRAGTPTTPKGAIGFIGPSELDTKTRWNNTNIAAIFQGILHENVNYLSAAMLRGKLELLMQFPSYVDNLSADSDRSPWFYFHCYNTLGDPGLCYFVGDVRALSAEVPATLALGTPSINLLVQESGENLGEVWATLKQDTVIVARAVGDESGHVVLSVPQAAAGTYQVTLTKPRHMPQITTLNVGQQQNSVAMSELLLVDDGSNGTIGNGNGLANNGETIAFRVRIRNYGSQPFSGGNLAISSADGSLTVVNGTVAIPTLAAGAQTGLLYLTALVNVHNQDGSSGRVDWSINDDDYEWTSVFDIYAGRAEVGIVHMNGGNRNPLPGESGTLDLQISNAGQHTIATVNAVLTSHDPRLVVTDSITQYGSINPGASGFSMEGFQIQCGQFYPGDRVPCELRLSGNNYSDTISFRLEIAELQDSDPTHPDEYGYRAFQETDDEYDEAPTYAWFEIDPTRGGPGTVFSLPDNGEGEDTTRAMALPFPFRYYGAEHTQISISSNGFVSFGTTRESYLRNYRLPAIASPENMIAVFWDDLSLPDDGRVCTYHDQQGARFIIEWSHLQNEYSSHPEETFQLILYDTDCWPTRTGDGNILIQWQQFNNIDSWDNYATIGLQDKAAGHHLLITYANELQPGVSIIRSGAAMLFTTGRPTDGAYVGYVGSTIDDDNEGGSVGNDDGVAQNGETVQMGLRLRNQGAGSSPAFAGTLVSADPRLVVMDTQVSFPALGPEEEAESSPVRIQISAQAPHGLVGSLLLSLTGDAAPCVVVATLAVSGPALSGLTPQMNDDAIPPSIGNGNGEVNPRETLELLPRVSNAGGNVANGVTAVLRRTTNDITLLDSTASFGNIDVGQEMQATEPFVLRLNNNVANGQTVRMQIIYRDQYGMSWSQNTSFLVVEPFIAIGDVRISDPAPGGNGDGYVVGGEAAEIYPAVRNDGLGAATNVVMSVVCSDTSVSVTNTTQNVGTVSGGASREPALPILVSVHPGNPEPRSVIMTVTVTADGGLEETKIVSLLVGIARFYADFEVNADRWSVFGRHGLWHVQDREYDSPTHAYYCGRETPRRYEGGDDEYLRSPQFTFAGHGTLVYSTRYETAGAGDVCRVQLQIGSSTYFLLDSYWGDQTEWQERMVSLAGYPAADDARIRFWFQSDISGPAEGWYVDNVLIVDEDLDVSDNADIPIPEQISLDQNFPNPFNDATEITYSLPKRSDIKITLHDVQGRKVTTLIEGAREAGVHTVRWQPLSLASGVYFVRLEAADVSISRKILYLK